MKELKCLHQIDGFTIGKSYKTVADGANVVKIYDDNDTLRVFNKVEGDRDFKNWFIGVIEKTA